MSPPLMSYTFRMWIINILVILLGIVFALQWPWAFAVLAVIAAGGHWMASRSAPIPAPKAVPAPGWRITFRP